MTKPYFEVGEEVILESNSYPQYNGEYTIQGVISRKEHDMLAAQQGEVFGVVTGDSFYDLGFAPPIETFSGKETGKTWAWWHQSALRKKLPPASSSFSEMMESFKEKDNA